MVGDSVMEEVKRVSSERKVPEYLNRTLSFLFQKFKAQKPLVITDLLVCATLLIRSSLRLLLLGSALGISYLALLNCFRSG